MSENNGKKTTTPQPAKTVPDGGWGWIVVGAVALINMTNQSLLSVFGLLFGTELRTMGHDTSVAALITNLNSLALNFSGLFIGPAIKSYKPRPVAATGCILVSMGMTVCAGATKIWHLIIGYSLMVGIGLGLIAPSTFMAINAYFTTKRGSAVGVSLAGAGLGQVFMPHLVRMLLEECGFRVTVLVMAALALTGIFGALMLRPLPSTSNIANTSQTISTTPQPSHNNCQQIQPLLVDNEKEDPHSTYKIHVSQVENSVPTHRKLRHKLCERVIQAMDLELLRDPIFWSLIVGMALVYTSTLQFTMLFPSFLLYSVNVSRSNTATCMSIVAGADIICRLLLPFITDKLRIPYRLIFFSGTLGLLLARTALAEAKNLPTLIAMCILTGIAKSATVLNNNLTISAHCRPEKLAGGLGLNMIAKAMLVISVGQLLGWIRDYSGSYVICLHAQNVLLLAVIIVWAPEMAWHWWQQRQTTIIVKHDSISKLDEEVKQMVMPVKLCGKLSSS